MNTKKETITNRLSDRFCFNPYIHDNKYLDNLDLNRAKYNLKKKKCRNH